MCAYIPSFTYPNPIYQPATRVIAAIQPNSFNPTTQMLVTTTVTHHYAPGMVVRFDIPLGFGMQGLNQHVGTILTIPTTTTFTTDLDVSKFDPFVLPATFPPAYQDALVVPVGDTGNYNLALQNVLPTGSNIYF